jgi:hypothetical protein
MPSDSLGKAAGAGITEAAAGKDSSAMRVLFFTWLTLIAAGLIFYSVIGLTHH